MKNAAKAGSILNRIVAVRRRCENSIPTYFIQAFPIRIPT
jgi:hypothetical protein